MTQLFDGTKPGTSTPLQAVEVRNNFNSVFSSNSGLVAPSGPVEGTLWWRPDLNQLFAYDGTGFILIAGITQSGQAQWQQRAGASTILEVLNGSITAVAGQTTTTTDLGLVNNRWDDLFVDRVVTDHMDFDDQAGPPVFAKIQDAADARLWFNSLNPHFQYNWAGSTHTIATLNELTMTIATITRFGEPGTGIVFSDVYIELDELPADPSTPAANQGRFYSKDASGESKPFWISDAGTVYDLTSDTHSLLSATHSDTIAGSPVRGDLIGAIVGATWTRLPIGTTNSVLASDGNDPAWTTLAKVHLPSTIVHTDQANLFGAFDQRFPDSRFQIDNPAQTFQYIFRASALAADRQVTLPLLTGNATFAFIDFAQTWNAIQTIDAAWTMGASGSLDAGGIAGELIPQTGAGVPSHAATEGTMYWDTTSNNFYVNNDGATAWTQIDAASTHNTLDQAYDQGGAGAGRTIGVDTGPVFFNGAIVPAGDHRVFQARHQVAGTLIGNSVTTVELWSDRDFSIGGVGQEVDDDFDTVRIYRRSIANAAGVCFSIAGSVLQIENIADATVFEDTTKLLELIQSADKSTGDAIDIRIAGQTFAQFTISPIGVMSWGAGPTAIDTQISRVAADTLELAAGDTFRLASGAKITPNGILGQIIVQTGAITPVHTADEGTLYWDTVANILYSNDDGATGWTLVGPGGGANHNLLSSTHPDTITDSPVRGDLIGAIVGATWTRLPIGATNSVLASDGNDPAWTSLAKAHLPGTIVYTDQANAYGAFAQRFPDQQLQIDNPAQTFQYIFRSSAIVADRDVTLPLLTGPATFAFIDFAQTWTAIQTIGSAWTMDASGSLSANGILGEIIPQTGAITPVHSASEGTLYWDTAADLFYINNNGATGWTNVGAGGGANTLDQAYDQGGAGAGRTITADTGAVQIQGTALVGDDLLDIDHTASGDIISNTTDVVTIDASRTLNGGADGLTDEFDLVSLTRTNVCNLGGQTFNATGSVLRLALSSTQISGTMADLTNLLELVHDPDAIASGDAFDYRHAGDGDPRVRITKAGALEFGSGVATPDISLSRVAANVLELASGDAHRIHDSGLQIRNPGDSFHYILRSSAIAADRDITLPLLTGADIFVFEAFAQTLTNKTIDTASNTITVDEADINDGSILARLAANEIITGQYEFTAATRFNDTVLQIDNPAQTFQYIFRSSALAADRDVTLPLLTGPDIFVFEAFAQTLTNKTIDTANNTLTIAEADITDGSILARVASAETITGGWDFTTAATQFRDTILQLANPANTFQYIFNTGAIAADRNINLPVLTGDATFAFIDFAQTFTAAHIIGAAWTMDASGSLSANGINGEIIIQTGAITPVHSASEGTPYWDTAANSLFVNNDGSTGWTQIGAGAGNTLDQAYDQGGAGAGRTIITSDGALELTLGATAGIAFLVTETGFGSGTFRINDGGLVELGSGTDLVVYSGDFATEVARIDGATGDISSAGDVTLAGDIIFDLANDITLTATNPAAPRTVTIPAIGQASTFAFLEEAATWTSIQTIGAAWTMDASGSLSANGINGEIIIQTGAGVPSHSATEGVLYFDTTGNDLYANTDGASTWAQMNGAGAGNTLDQAYDEGGVGAGRTINATDGAVQFLGVAAGGDDLIDASTIFSGTPTANTTDAVSLVSSRTDTGGATFIDDFDVVSISRTSTSNHASSLFTSQGSVLKLSNVVAQLLGSITDTTVLLEMEGDTLGTGDALTLMMDEEVSFRFTIGQSGELSWGSGGAALDVVLSRTAANTLTLATGDTFVVENMTGGSGGTGVINYGDAASFEIPSPASPSLTADGMMAIDNTQDTLQYRSSGANHVISPEYSKSITIENPTASENILIFRIDEKPITITKVVAYVQGTGSPSVTIDPRHGTDRTAAGTDLFATPQAITNETTGAELTTFSDASMAVNEAFWLVTTAVGGTTQTELHLTIFYTVDA